MPGPLPKPAALRQRVNRAATAATLAPSPAHETPLPAGAWHPRAREWWEFVWRSPARGEWVAADVPGLLALAALIEAYWQRPRARTAREIRMQLREYGLTPYARHALGIREVTHDE